jgi:hypothetical protein
MTEDQIERQVERMTDALDRRYLPGSMTADEYNAECRRIDAWARDALAEPDVARLMLGADISECFQWLKDAGLRIGPGEFWPWLSQDGATRGAVRYRDGWQALVITAEALAEREDPTRRAQWIGAVQYGTGLYELVRLASPCLDIFPEVRNVVRVRGQYYQGAAYHCITEDRWKVAPNTPPQRCYQRFTWEDAAYAALCFRVAT